jgi:hypothetical protein
VDGKTAGADEDGELLEPQIRDDAQGLFPVGADALLSPKDAWRFTRDLDDARRRHLEGFLICERMRGRSWALQAAIHSSAKRSAKSRVTGGRLMLSRIPQMSRLPSAMRH